ncbi:hypothetical protein IFM89_012722 [Coptis chinensis]|uniref:Uncharacterized protein n=1 Tax=Coptis chinensis TaxID=261450 RepID=A0A835HDR5_9MAGN|nr:hypothetical protein IFM89_012722 [Coptis chinensis]
MNLLLYMAPMAALILLPFTLYIEGNIAAVTIQKVREDSFIVFLLLGNSTVAYLVNLTNFLVTKHTSALTLQCEICSGGSCLGIDFQESGEYNGNDWIWSYNYGCSIVQ